MKKIAGFVIVAAALVLIVILASDFINSNKKTSDSTESSSAQKKSGISETSDFKEIEKVLKEYPEKLSEKDALEKGMIVIINQKFQKDGSKLWKEFSKKVQKKTDGAVILCHFTTEGDPILQYISYLDGKFYYVEDSTRDSFGSEKYVEHTYDYFKQYEADKVCTVFLTNKEQITLDEAQDARNLKTAIQILEVKADQLK